MRKKLLFFSICSIFVSVSSYVVPSESESSEWSVVSANEPKYKFCKKHPEMTVVEAVHRASSNLELGALNLLFDDHQMFSRFGAGVATKHEANSLLEGVTPLMRSIMYGPKRIQKSKVHKSDLAKVAKFLVEQGARVDTCNEQERNALMCAAAHNCNPGLFKFLVESVERLALDMRDKDGNTVAHYAIRSPELLKILKEAGADIRIRNQKGLSPLELIAIRLVNEDDKFRKVYKRSVRVLSDQ